MELIQWQMLEAAGGGERDGLQIMNRYLRAIDRLLKPQSMPGGIARNALRCAERRLSHRVTWPVLIEKSNRM